MRPESKPKVKLNEKEEAILNKMKSLKACLLPELRGQFDYSNKAWDTSIKTLTKNKLLSVSKEGEDLWVKTI